MKWPCALSAGRPAAFDTTDQLPSTARFVIVDEYQLAGGGIIVEALQDEDYDVRNIRSSGSVTETEREKLTGRKGYVVWLTGLSGAGKSTLATAAERQLLSRGIAAFTLDGDVLRGAVRDLDFPTRAALKISAGPPRPPRCSKIRSSCW